MQFKTFFLLFLASFLVAGAANAQSVDASTHHNHKAATTHIGNTAGQDWTFYLDAEKQVYYIDFESINVNLSDITVKNAKGKVVLTDKLWDLPVDTIYELDMKGMNPGKYQIELRSFTGIIRKEVVVEAD